MSCPVVYAMQIGGGGDLITGSCTVLKIVCEKTYYGIIDCGLSQGEDEIRNFRFPLSGKNLDFAIVTHAHADHFLALPLLREYKGRVYGTREAFEQGFDLLLDCAKINEGKAAERMGLSTDSFYSMKKELETLQRRFSGGNPSKYKEFQEIEITLNEIKSNVLYDKEDISNISKRFFPVAPYKEFKIGNELYIRLIPNSHQNGAVSIELYAGEPKSDDCVSICFSGDIGPKDSLLYKDLSYSSNPYIKYAWMEATHGIKRRTESTEEAYETFKNEIFDAEESGKDAVIIAAPALDKTAKILYFINRMIDETNFYAYVYWDTPLGYKELQHYKMSYRENSFWFDDLGKSPFDDNECFICNRYEDHIDALNADGFKIIIVASVFGEGNRIKDYFSRYIEDENAVFIFPSWLSNDCPSGILCNACECDEIVIHEKKYVKLCKTVQIHGLSGHGYFEEYESFVNSFPNLKGLVINHGGMVEKQELRDELAKSNSFSIEIPDVYNSENETNCFYRLDANGITPVEKAEGMKQFSDVL